MEAQGTKQGPEDGTRGRPLGGAHCLVAGGIHGFGRGLAVVKLNVRGGLSESLPQLHSIRND